MSETELRNHIDKLAEGVRNKDIAGLKQLYATDIVSFDIEPPLQHVGRDAKLKNWANVFAVFEEVTYEVRDLKLTVGEGVAFGHCFARLAGTLKGGTSTDGMWVRWTFCFREIAGTWLITHDQISVPLDMPSGQGATDLEP